MKTKETSILITTMSNTIVEQVWKGYAQEEIDRLNNQQNTKSWRMDESEYMYILDGTNMVDNPCKLSEGFVWITKTPRVLRGLEKYLNSKIAVHPGEILKEFYIDPLNLNVDELAIKLNIPNLRGIVECRSEIDIKTAFKLAVFFNTSPDFWLSMQLNHYLVQPLSDPTKEKQLNEKDIKSESDKINKQIIEETITFELKYINLLVKLAVLNSESRIIINKEFNNGTLLYLKESGFKFTESYSQREGAIITINLQNDNNK